MELSYIFVNMYSGNTGSLKPFSTVALLATNSAFLIFILGPLKTWIWIKSAYYIKIYIFLKQCASAGAKSPPEYSAPIERRFLVQLLT
jgi:hypothetical protein